MAPKKKSTIKKSVPKTITLVIVGTQEEIAAWKNGKAYYVEGTWIDTHEYFKEGYFYSRNEVEAFFRDNAPDGIDFDSEEGSEYLDDRWIFSWKTFQELHHDAHVLETEYETPLHETIIVYTYIWEEE